MSTSIAGSGGSAWNSEEGRTGLRVAIAVTTGFTYAVVTGAIIPFLGPIFAAQFLLASRRPIGLGKVVGMVVLMIAGSLFMDFLVGIFGDRPFVMIPVLAVIYFACFYLKAANKGAALAFPLLILTIMIPLLGILNRDLGASVASLLVSSIAGGAVLSWLAYAMVPPRTVEEEDQVETTASPRPVAVAAASAGILVLIVVMCLTNDAYSTALVIPITVASLLLQLDVVTSARTASALALVNFFGGAAACVFYAVLQVRESVTFLFLTVLLATLIMGGYAATKTPVAKVFAGALTIFLLVLGLAVSPLPGTAAETFSTRIANIAIAIFYTLLMAAILLPRGAAKPQFEQATSPAR